MWYVEDVGSEDIISKGCGMYQWVCRSVKISSVQQQPCKDSSDEGDVLLRAVNNGCSTGPWTITLQINGKPIEFCIDTGAEVTVVPESTYKEILLCCLWIKN